MEKVKARLERLRPLILSAWVVALALVAWGTLSPAVQVPHEHSADKFIHLGAWALLAFLPGISVRPRHAGRWAIGLTAVASVLLELGQAIVPGREASVLDLLGNLVGISLGAAAAWWLASIMRLR